MGILIWTADRSDFKVVTKWNLSSSGISSKGISGFAMASDVTFLSDRHLGVTFFLVADFSNWSITSKSTDSLSELFKQTMGVFTLGIDISFWISTLSSLDWDEPFSVSDNSILSFSKST